ncbi:2-dehydro-3-deoxygalactonokinase [Undibacterium sp. RuTC16W]|uniref:2-dehydro-3-deoxygalactonokinase n=1 Tax=Undibacterium sp. RuTC16W TaxID=3413048 RepID=UPI003BF06D3C
MVAGSNDPVHADTYIGVIGIDWGSTGLRVFLMGAGGEVLATRTASHGISAITASPRAYAAALRKLAGDWLDMWPNAPVLACGMVGSQHGWQEVPYITCPASAEQIARGAARVVNSDSSHNQSLWIMPGLLHSPEAAAPDVMRGEETQIIGALQSRTGWSERACIVMPGTHSKWAHISNAQVLGFATHMTGELFALLRQHSVLGRLMPSNDNHIPDNAAFISGIDVAKNLGYEGLSHQLFAVRSLGLVGKMPATGLADYLSGLLIGHELNAGLHWRTKAGLNDAALILVGELSLCQRYQQALERFDVKADVVLPNTAPAGLWHLASVAGLLATPTSQQDSI